MSSKLRVAAVPMFGIRSVDESCAYIVEKIVASALAGAEVVVFPETATDSYQRHPQEDRAAIQRWLPQIVEAVGRAAGPWVILGTYTYREDGHHNSALVIDPQGTTRAVYDKISEGGTRWLLLDIGGVRCTVVICADFWVPGILLIPKMLGAQVCLYPHGSGPVTREREDWSALYYTRAWESRMFLVMADCSWLQGDPFARPQMVPYPYDFQHHQWNQSCIIGPQPRVLARALRDEQDGMLLADIDPGEAKGGFDPEHYTVGKPWKEMLRYYQEQGHIEWMR
ncbi:MAG: carbon-nitrogen hydrolase family protein [Anaerolineae bacterium]|nr:carbon-nitrogen hydrolase family protein [Anaerolineae bacterium]